MNILISNDDGIHARGLRVLADALSSVGEVWVVAPDRERSASGHSLTLNRPLRVTKVAPTWFTVDGTPTDCIALALMGMINRKFDLVASGINVGGNMGDDVTYSGTVSAAFEATLLGLPAFALSVVAHRKVNFSAAEQAAVMVARLIAKHGLPADTMLNVNVPNCRPSAIKGVAITQQGRRRYGDNIIVRKVDPRGKAYYWIGGKEPTWEPLKESDYAAVTAGSISITPLHLDLTNSSVLEKLQKWEFHWDHSPSTAGRRRGTARKAVN
ncbi:MAG: 5'/3'-nucleotidase SurE [bacterium]|uniref:5'-nucleotidase SurE n=1 Tax=Candidatus Methylomirabilis tolerans TaxID=3123416 RepID=A0AAJ1AHS3_9BACT|nr:5'/3'-nucleotidase SurE [Candidatus Methylomirabilis sp.]